MPANSASTCAVPMTPASLNSSVLSSLGGRWPRRSRTSARRRASSPPKRMKPLTMRKIDAASGLVNSTRSRCSKRTPVMPAGMVATTRSQPSRSVGSRDRPRAGRVEQAGDDRLPLLPEEDDQSKRRPDVERHDEGEPERLWLALGGDEVVPAEEGREHDGVAEARDGEELADALKHPEDDRLEVGDLGCGAGACVGAGRHREKVRRRGTLVIGTGGAYWPDVSRNWTWSPVRSTRLAGGTGGTGLQHRRRFGQDADLSTLSISSNCSCPQMSGGRQLDDRVATVVGPADQPRLEERRREEAPQEPLGFVVR